MEEKLTATRVDEVFKACLFQGDEDKTDYVKAEGINMTVGFHPGRLEQHRHDIEEMLGELPDMFFGVLGNSFLNACLDKKDRHWTGIHRIMEQLFLLGIGIGKVSYLFPREKWSELYGGMPIIKIDTLDTL